jgi:hypothetical protein
MAGMPVVLVLAALVILAGVVVVAMGKGGELALPRPDSAAFGRELVTPADMATFRPPAAFLGYSAQVTDDALRRIARAVAERDSELAMLRREVAVLRAREVGAAEAGGRAGPRPPGTRPAGQQPARQRPPRPRPAGQRPGRLRLGRRQLGLRGPGRRPGTGDG